MSESWGEEVTTNGGEEATALENEEVSKNLNADLSKFLNKNEEMVIRCRYGLGAKLLTLKEIGTLLSLTPERIRQIQNVAEKKLSRELEYAVYR